MFSDTHFHMRYLSESGADIAGIFTALAARGVSFALDIGTKPDDIDERARISGAALDAVGPPEARNAARDFLRYSLGIWPAKEAIADRENAMRELRAGFERAKTLPALAPKIAALGECGLDHHWNPSGADGRSEDDFDEKTVAGEAELFEAQLALARELALPVIVHSRDAFDGTLSCIANVGYDRGIIHCFSYGIGEARAFLDRGWYISFSGSITYTKKARAEETRALIRFIPRDKILIETDAPFLAPAPHRGKTNTPVWAEYVYRYAAECLETPPEALSALVDENIRCLFYPRGGA